MEQNLENKTEAIDRLQNFFKQNRKKIFIFLACITISIISLIFYQNYEKKKNILAAEKYVKAQIQLSLDKNNAKNLFEEIILSKNKFYSILALNTIIEKKLFNDPVKILNFFEIIEDINYSEEKKDLMTFKKALYLFKISKTKEGKDLLNNLIKKDSKIKNLAIEIIEN